MSNKRKNTVKPYRSSRPEMVISSDGLMRAKRWNFLLFFIVLALIFAVIFVKKTDREFMSKQKDQIRCLQGVRDSLEAENTLLKMYTTDSMVRSIFYLDGKKHPKETSPRFDPQ